LSKQTMSDNDSLFAVGLSSPTELELARLAAVLWEWADPYALASDALHTACSSRGHSLAQYKPFLDHYRLLALSYSPLDDPPAIRTHEDVCSLILALKENPHHRKSQIAREHFRKGEQKDGGTGYSADEDAAMNLALTVMTMVNCISQGASAVLLEEGSNRTPWRWEVSMEQYISLVLPRKNNLAAKY